MLLDKLRPQARLSLHFRGITCSALIHWFNICFPTHNQYKIPPRQISSLLLGYLRMLHCPLFFEEQSYMRTFIWGTSPNVYKAVTSESSTKIIGIYGISVAQSFPTACRVHTNSFMSCLFPPLSHKSTVISLQFWRNENAFHFLNGACTEGTSLARELPWSFVTKVFTSMLEITLKDHFFMLKVSATRALGCSYLLFHPSSPLMTLSFLFYERPIWIQCSKGQYGLILLPQLFLFFQPHYCISK